MAESNHADTQHIVAIPYLVETLAFLLTVLVVIPACKRLKVSPIIGFLAVGSLIGPYSFGLVKNVEAVQHLAELGVIFLLFTIGLELSFERLAVYAKHIFGMGSLHFVLCALVIGAFAYAWGNSVNASIILGMCLALSSTAVVMQILNEKKEIATSHGRSVFTVLLFQDLMVVPILIIVTIFGQQSDEGTLGIVLEALVKAVLAIGGIIFLGRYVLRYLFRIAASTHAPEMFMAAMLITILFTATVTGVSGLSMALGAFLAGLLLAETEYKHQIETDIEPFKGLFLGLFFAGVGMNIDFGLAFERSYWVVLSVVGLILVKAVCGFIAAMVFRLGFANSLRVALYLSEAGEFAFLVIGQASLTFNIVDIAIGQFMVVVAGLSMALTPVIIFLAGLLARRLEPVNNQTNALDDHAKDEHHHVIIAGFGRVGRAVANVLNNESIPFVALDTDPVNVSACHKDFDLPVYHGDASNGQLLKKAGVGRAKAVVLTMNDPKAVTRAVAAIRQQCKTTPVIVRSKNNQHSQELMDQGATLVVPELHESSLQLAGHALCAYNYTREEADACIELVRRHNYQELNDQP